MTSASHDDVPTVVVKLAEDLSDLHFIRIQDSLGRYNAACAEPYNVKLTGDLGQRRAQRADVARCPCRTTCSTATCGHCDAGRNRRNRLEQVATIESILRGAGQAVC